MIKLGSCSNPTASPQLKVLTFTSLFPNQQQPLHGVFVRERIQALARLCNLQVIAPVPWAPSARWLGQRYYTYSQVLHKEQDGDITVWHPRFVVIPKLFKSLDGLLLGACSLAPVKTVRRLFPFDLIDAHWAYPDGVAAAVLAMVFHVPFSITVRGDDINILPHDVRRRYFIQWALKRANLVIALSKELKENVEALGVSSSRTVVIPNGVDTEIFTGLARKAARVNLGISEGDRILLSVGRLHKSKGYPVIVGALARLKDKFPSLRLVIAGGADHEADATPDIYAAVSRYGLENRVSLIGPQPRLHLNQWYKAADLFCLATTREGSANVLLEAIASGLPCITTPVGGNPEVIDRPELGILAPPSEDAMAGAIEMGLSRAWDRDFIAGRARTRPWSVVAEECYKHLLNLVSRTA